MRISGRVLSSDSAKASIFNKFFAATNKSSKRKVLDKALGKVLRSKEKSSLANIPLFEENFTIHELQSAMGKLQLRKAPGPDKISNEMILHLGPVGKSTLLNFINKTWQSGVLPKSWKSAIVRPILKKGKPEDDLKSFRPISLTSNIGKLAERMLNNRLYWWLESSGSLNNFQAGFRKGSRTEDQLFLLTQSVKDSFLHKRNSVAAFVDFQQAYDRVWRKGLLLKMQNMGIHGKMYQWVKNYLSNRTIQTQVNNSLSNKHTLEEGLPQGSALSCTLFLIFINDLPNLLNTHKAMFADDLVIWTSGTDLQLAADRLNRALLTISAYCNFWKLKINVSKTTYTVFTLSNKLAKTELKITLDGAQIMKEKNPTYLGVKLDRKLNFKEFMDGLADKASKRLNLLKRLASTSWGANKATLRQLYTGYVRSVIDYNLPLQATASKSSRTQVDRIQNQAIHFICGAMRSTPTAACEIDANIEPLDIRREKSTIEAVERYRRMPLDHPNRIVVDKWKHNNRLKLKTPMHIAEQINTKHKLPEDREELTRVPDIPPNTNYTLPQTNTRLKNKLVNKSSDPNTLKLKLCALETIESYPKDWIHAYTDGSAFKETDNAGYGVLIMFPDKTTSHISAPCGSRCSNYDAEMQAILAALAATTTKYKNSASHPKNLVIFSDSQSALQTLENWIPSADHITTDILSAVNQLASYDIKTTLQWIPGHIDIRGNERADRLAKSGATMSQPHIPTNMRTVKHIIHNNCKQHWMDSWASNPTGRSLYTHLPKPNPGDHINSLCRRDQCTIFRLRTGHITLNKHLHRVTADHTPYCMHCNRQEEETVKHHLLDCSALKDLRKNLIPSNSSITDILYGNVEQLKRTCTFHYLAQGKKSENS